MSKEKTTTDQHSNLRKRLQDELSYLRSTIESNDVDWFLKSSNLSNNNNLTPIKSPSMENSNNSKAPPSLSTTNANVLSTSPTAKPSYSGVPLQRSKTADARYSSSLSKSTTNSSSNSDFGASSNKLSRTATNITTYLTTNSDIKANTNTNANSNSANRRRTTSFSDSSSSTKKKGGFFKRLLGKSSNDDDSNGSSPSNTATSSNASSRRTSIAAPSNNNNNNNIPSSPTSHHLPLKKSIDGFVDPIEQKTSTFDNKAKSTIERKNSKHSSSLEKKSTSSSYSQTASASSTTSSSSPYSFQTDDTMDEKLAQYLKDIELYKDETDPCPYKPDTPAMDPSQRIQNRIAEALPHPSVLAAESSTNSLSSSDKELDDLLPKFDKLPIPPHPDKPKLPSALTKHPKFNTLKEQDFQSRVQLQLQQHQAELLLEKQKESSGVFGSILGRRKTITSTPNENDLKKILSGTSDSDASVASSSTNLIKSSDAPIVYAKPPVKKDRRPPIKILNELPPMKKVAFATTTFVYDPPQQIPSRNPRKGNVEIGAHGELIIHKLSDEDKLNTSSGIVVGGSGHLRLVSEEKMVTNTQHQQRVEGAAKAAAADAAKAAGGSPSPSPSTEESTSSSSIGSAPMKSSSSNASFDHTINISDRVKAAQRAHDDSTHGSGGIQNGKMSHLHIDKPMIRRRKSKSMDKPLVTLKIDELYTRCCHLREILPIPATLKQIPKGSTDPLPILQLRNPKPSMIEVLSFSDFIRVAPIVCVSLDGVNLTTKMFRIILSALLNKRYLEKLSLRNTPINQDGWKLLCWFLSMNKSLKRLDITQCSSLHLNTQRLRPSTNKTASSASNPAVVSVKTMVGNTNDRSDMDWSLLSASIIYRGGIEEIILTGCKINDLIVFKSFLNYALTLKTLKIGLAYNELSYNQCEIIAQWLSRSQKILGIDLGFNDFSNNNLKPFIEFAKISLNSNLTLISFSNCNLNDNEDTNHIFDLFSRLPSLKYLDISSNKKLFKTFTTSLCTYLPFITSLYRLDLSNNDLTTNSLLTLFEILPLCKNLNYLSIIGNKLDHASCLALIKAVKNCKTLCQVEFDKDEITSNYEEKIGLLTIRNMERELYNTQNNSSTTKSDLPTGLQNEINEFKKSILGTDKISFTEYISKLISDSETNNSIDIKEVDEFIEKLNKMRVSLHKFIDILVDLRLKDKISGDGKETLFRLALIDSSIKNGLKLICSKYNKKFNDNFINNDFTDRVIQLEKSSGSNSTTITSNSTSTGKTTLASSNNNVNKLSAGDETVEIKDDNETNPVKSLSSLSPSSRDYPSTKKYNDEEGKTFKITSSIINDNKLHDKVQEKVSSSAFEGLTGEEIRSSLLETPDVLKLIGVLDKLKQQGLIADIYSKNAISDTVNSLTKHSTNEEKKGYFETYSNTVMNRGNGHSSTGILPTPSHQEHHHQHHHEDGNDNEDDASIDSLEFVDQNGETNSINNNNSNSNNGGSDDTNLKADDIYDKLLDEIVKKITHKLN